jgi:tRNA(Ile)-lysidine synthase
VCLNFWALTIAVISFIVCSMDFVSAGAVFSRGDLLSYPLIVDLLDRCTFPEAGTALTCGVSGGVDSTALMVLAVAAGCDVTAIHVDHGLRPGSETEADVVARNAALFGAQFRSERVQVAPGGNLEARARDARYGVLGASVATGHTSDDQAETVLLNLLRGTGLAGLRGIEPGFRHPILGLRRSETEAVCELFNLEIVHDPTNDETDFRRNKVRHLVMPLLNEIAERDVVPLLTRTASQCQVAHAELHDVASSAVDDPSDVSQLRAAGDAVASVVLHGWLKPFVGSGKVLDAASVSRVLDVVHHRVQGAQLPGGSFVRRRNGKLFVVQEHNLTDRQKI